MRGAAVLQVGMTGSECLSYILCQTLGKCSLLRGENTSIETGDFLQKNVKCMLVEFCISVTPSPHVGVKATCCYIILGNVFLLNGGSSHQPSAKA